jgi:hypothetical protein
MGCYIEKGAPLFRSLYPHFLLSLFLYQNKAHNADKKLKKLLTITVPSPVIIDNQN